MDRISELRRNGVPTSLVAVAFPAPIAVNRSVKSLSPLKDGADPSSQFTGSENFPDEPIQTSSAEWAGQASRARIAVGISWATLLIRGATMPGPSGLNADGFMRMAFRRGGRAASLPTIPECSSGEWRANNLSWFSEQRALHTSQRDPKGVRFPKPHLRSEGKISTVRPIVAHRGTALSRL